jgi:aspartokinase-like uncharacterized kinase
MSAGLRIVKVGGSLFELPDLAERLRRWLAMQSRAINVLIAGGGPLADQVRRWDQQFELGEEKSHWLCVDVLDVTAQLLKALLAEAPICWTYTELHNALRAGGQGSIVFPPAAFLRSAEAQFAGLPLPHSWDVTSDSIGARLAEIVGADELVLLKSLLPEPYHDAAELAGEYVDRHFFQAARNVQARFVNLRDDNFPDVIASR